MSKTLSVDGTRIFIGLVNFDPRSANLNTKWLRYRKRGDGRCACHRVYEHHSCTYEGG